MVSWIDSRPLAICPADLPGFREQTLKYMSTLETLCKKLVKLYALALDLAASGITVNVVAPGWFDSPLAERWKQSPELEAGVLGHTAQRRWGTSTDLAGAYLFLASDASAFITGTVLDVDGGYLLV